MKIFVGLSKDENDDYSCYINVFNIDYVVTIDGGENTKTAIRFKGSGNQINSPLPIKEVMRRINNAINSFENKKKKEEITRAELMDLEE